MQIFFYGILYEALYRLSAHLSRWGEWLCHVSVIFLNKQTDCFEEKLKEE